MAPPGDDRFDREMDALVLKLGSYRLHHGGVAVVRSLGRAGVRVFGVHEDRLAAAATSRYLRGGFVWPTTRETITPAQFAQGMAAIAARIGRPVVVIPTDDHAAVLLDDCRAQLPEQLRLPALRPGLARRLADKGTCAELARAAGLSVPSQTVLTCPVSDAALREVALPAVVKRAERALLADGSRTFSTVIARSEDQLRELLQDRRTGPYEVLVQERFAGDDWLYHGYCDARSAALVSFTGRKLRSRPAFAGETAFGRAETNLELRASMEAFLRSIGYTGIVSMDLRYRRETDEFVLLDVNPRAGASFRLFVNGRGIDVVRALHLDLSGREVPQAPQHDGRTYMVENYDFAVRRAYGGDLHAWAKALRQSDERAWLQADDLLPALVAGAQLPFRRADRFGHRARLPAAPQFFHGRGHAG